MFFRKANQRSYVSTLKILLLLFSLPALAAEDSKALPAFYSDLSHADLYFNREPHHLILDRGVVELRTDSELRIKTAAGDVLKLKGTLLDGIAIGESVDALWMDGNVVSIKPVGIQLPLEFRQAYHVDMEVLRGQKKVKASCDSGAIVSTGDKLLIFKRKDGTMMQMPLNAEIIWDESKGHILRSEVKPSMSIVVVNLEGKYRISVSEHPLHAANSGVNPQNESPQSKPDDSREKPPRSL